MKLRKAQSDFTIDDLPKNRREVFLDCLKERFMLFLSMGLTLLVFALPLIVVTLLNDNALSGLYLTFADGGYSQEEYVALVRAANSMYSLFFIPCYVVLSVGLAGVMLVIRQLVWGEGVFFMQDMAEGIKSNGKNYVVIAFILGLLSFLLNTFLPLSTNPFYIVVIILFALLSFPPTGFMVSQIVIYKNTFFKYLRDGVYLCVRKVPITLLFMVLFMLPSILGMNFLPFLAKYIMLAIFFILPAPMLLTGWFLYTCSVFDEYINKEQYPEIHDKGVYRKGADGRNVKG